MKRCLLLVLILTGLSATAPACMNDYVPNVAAIERSHSVLDQLQKHVVAEPWETRRDRLRKALADGGDYRVKNDLATSLAHTGEAAEAVTLLEQIEAEKPGLYVTAANLGTAYELAGNNEKALEWIRKGIERNAQAHEGTEWLHVRILEAKLELEKDKFWLDDNSVLGPRIQGRDYRDVYKAAVAAVGNRGEKLTTEQVKAAVIYQLHERLQFVNPPDAIVGTLLFDLGDLLSEESTGTGGAKDVFDLSRKYLSELDTVVSIQLLVDQRRDFSRRGQRSPDMSRRNSFLIMLGFVVLLLGIVVFALLRWIWRALARKGHKTSPTPLESHPKIPAAGPLSERSEDSDRAASAVKAGKS